MSFADRLKSSRKEKGISQEQLAEGLEVSRQSITKWETGTAYPELKKLLLLSIKLDKELDWLLCDERSELAGSRQTVDEAKNSSRQIYDMRSLKSAMLERLVNRILEALEGYEFREDVKEEDFIGVRVYVVFASRMYLAANGRDPESGALTETFSELKTEQIIDFLVRQAQALRIRQG